MNQGEIWLINLDPTIGAEIRKSRPAVIVNDDAIGILPLKVVVPITEWKDHYAAAPWLVRLLPDSENGLEKPSAADAFQVRSVSQQRFVRRIGKLSETQLQTINQPTRSILIMLWKSRIPDTAFQSGRRPVTARGISLNASGRSAMSTATRKGSPSVP